MKPYRVVFYVDEAGEHRWRMKAGNNRIVATSGEGYSSYRKVVEAWHRVEVHLAFGLWTFE